MIGKWDGTFTEVAELPRRSRKYSGTDKAIAAARENYQQPRRTDLDALAAAMRPGIVYHVPSINPITHVTCHECGYTRAGSAKTSFKARGLTQINRNGEAYVWLSGTVDLNQLEAGNL